MAACIGPPALGIAAVQGGAPQFTAGTSTITYNFAAAQNAGDAIVVFVSGNLATGTPSSIADTSGNSYTPVTNTDSADFVCYVALNIKAASAGANTVTATLSGAATFACLSAVEYQPSPGNRLSIVDQNFANATGATSSSSQTFSPQYCCEMAINCVVARNTTAPVGESGWTTEGTGTDGLFQGMLYQDQIQTTRSNLTITATGLGSISYASLAIGIAINAAPPTSLGTVTCFAYLPTGSTSGAFWHICDPGIGDGDGWIGQNTTTPGLQISNPNGTNPTAKTVLTKQWYFLSARISATEISQTACAVGSGSDLVAAIVAAGLGAFAPAAFAMGIDLLLSGNGGSALNSQGFLTGSIAGLKVWTNGAWLSDAELVAESSQLAAVRQADLWAGMKFQGEGNNLNLVVEEGMAAGLTFAQLGTNQVSFAPDPPIPRVKQYRDWGLKKNTNTAVAFALAIVGQATIVDAVNVARSLAAAIVGGATIAQAVVVARKFSLSIGGTALLADKIAVARALKSAMAGAAATSDAMSVKRAMVEAVGAHASVTAAAKVARSLLEAIHGTSAYAATSIIARAMMVAIEGAAMQSASLSRARPMVAGVVGTATVAESLAVARGLNAAIAGRSVVSPSLNAIRPLSLAVAGEALASLMMSVGRPLSLAAEGRSAASLLALVNRPLMMSVEGRATLTAALDVESGGSVSFAMAILGHASTASAVKLARAISLSVDGSSVLNPLLGIKRPISTAVHAAASLSVTLARLKPMIVSVDGAASAAFANSLRKGFFVPIDGQGSVSPSFTRLIAMTLPLHSRAVVDASMARSAPLAFSAAGAADMLAGLFIGTGPMGPLRIAAANLAIISWSAFDAPIVSITAADALVVPIASSNDSPIVIAAADGAIVAIATTDGPPT